MTGDSAYCEQCGGTGFRVRLVDGYERAKKILEENRETLVNMSEALLIRESLDSKEINELMKGSVLITDQEREEYKVRLAKEQEELKKADKPEPVENKSGDEGEDGDPDKANKNLTPMPQGM